MTTDAASDRRREQEVANLRLYREVIDTLNHICDIYDTDWSERQRQAVGSAAVKAEECLENYENQSQWNLMEQYTLQNLMATCKLEMQPEDLRKPDDKPNIVEILNVKRIIQDQRNSHKGRIVHFTEMLDTALAEIDTMEGELRASQLDGSALAAVPITTLDQVEKAMNVTSIKLSLHHTEDVMENLHQKLEAINEQIVDAEHNGDTVRAAELAYSRIATLEDLIVQINTKFQKVAEVEGENEQFRHIHETQKHAHAAAAIIREETRQLKARCEADQAAIHEAIFQKDQEDAEARMKFATSKANSDKHLKENLHRQAEGWSRIQDTEKQLRRLARERMHEIRIRMEEHKQESTRQVKYEQFLSVVSQQRHLLEITVRNCDTMTRCVTKMDNLVNTACAAIKARYDELCNHLAELKLAIHREYLEHFSHLYRAVGQMIHRQERKKEELTQAAIHAEINLQFCVETFDPAAKKHSVQKLNLNRQVQAISQELQKLYERRANALAAFKPTEEALLAARIDFPDPVATDKAETLRWRTKMVQYRSQLTEQVEIKIAAEREAIKHTKNALEEGSIGALAAIRGS